jgi:hypothetical protein
VTLEVFDPLGRVVKRLIDRENQGPGTKFVEFDAGNVPSGVYFYRITTHSFTEMKKMILLR